MHANHVHGLEVVIDPILHLVQLEQNRAVDVVPHPQRMEKQEDRAEKKHGQDADQGVLEQVLPFDPRFFGLPSHRDIFPSWLGLTRGGFRSFAGPDSKKHKAPDDTTVL